MAHGRFWFGFSFLRPLAPRLEEVSCRAARTESRSIHIQMRCVVSATLGPSVCDDVMNCLTESVVDVYLMLMSGGWHFAAVASGSLLF